MYMLYTYTMSETFQISPEKNNKISVEHNLYSNESTNQMQKLITGLLFVV